jgi:hypothetical protein
MGLFLHYFSQNAAVAKKTIPFFNTDALWEKTRPRCYGAENFSLKLLRRVRNDASTVLIVLLKSYHDIASIEMSRLRLLALRGLQATRQSPPLLINQSSSYRIRVSFREAL